MERCSGGTPRSRHTQLGAQQSRRGNAEAKGDSSGAARGDWTSSLAGQWLAWHWFVSGRWGGPGERRGGPSERAREPHRQNLIGTGGAGSASSTRGMGKGGESIEELREQRTYVGCVRARARSIAGVALRLLVLLRPSPSALSLSLSLSLSLARARCVSACLSALTLWPSCREEGLLYICHAHVPRCCRRSHTCALAATLSTLCLPSRSYRGPTLSRVRRRGCSGRHGLTWCSTGAT